MHVVPAQLQNAAGAAISTTVSGISTLRLAPLQITCFNGAALTLRQVIVANFPPACRQK